MQIEYSISKKRDNLNVQDPKKRKFVYSAPKKSALRPREAPERGTLEKNNHHCVDVAPAVPPGPILRLVGDPRRAACPTFFASVDPPEDVFLAAAPRL